MSIIIKAVKSKSDLKRYVKFNIDLYKDSPYHVPEIISDEFGTLSKDINPAFEFCEAVYFLAYRDGKIVGRIAGIINHKANKKWGKHSARFGFVDFVNDKEVSSKLFEAVENWAKERGMVEIHGPVGFTDLDKEGTLIEGFDQMGTIASIYNHPYYAEHIEGLGFEKEVDWVEYKIMVPDAIPEKHQRISSIVEQKYGLKVKKYKSSKKLVQDYGQKIFELINVAYSELYGYSELSQKQIDYYIKLYLPMARMDLIPLIVDEQGELVGFGIALPSMASAMRKNRGRLFPFGFIHVLKALKRKNKVVDLMLVAVRPDYQDKGVNALLFSDMIPTAQKNGALYAESNPELEGNIKVQSQWQYFERIQHKRRRAYSKQLS